MDEVNRSGHALDWTGRESGEDVARAGQSPSLERQLHHRANNTLHVCWHRGTTLGQAELHRAGRNQLSGYLLRKFRNSGGWQKLWVVYAHFCLFFYKSHMVSTGYSADVGS